MSVLRGAKRPCGRGMRPKRDASLRLLCFWPRRDAHVFPRNSAALRRAWCDISEMIWLGKQSYVERECKLRVVDSNFLGHSLRTWESHPLKLRTCLSQTLRNPDSSFLNWPHVERTSNNRAYVLLRTTGVNTNGAAAKVMNFDRWGKRYALSLLGW